MARDKMLSVIGVMFVLFFFFHTKNLSHAILQLNERCPFAFIIIVNDMFYGSMDAYLPALGSLANICVNS